MGVGLPAIMPLLSMGSKLFMGGGQAQAAGAPAAPGPFDAISQGAPMGGGMPMPEQNPAFASDRSLFGGATPNTTPLPQRKSISLFDEELDAGRPTPPMPGRGAVPIPERGDRAMNALAGGPDGSEYGMFLDAQAADDAEKAASLFATKPTSATTPINSADPRGNAQRFKDAGYTLDSRTAEATAPGPVKAAKAAKPVRVAAPEPEEVDDYSTSLNSGEVKADNPTLTKPAPKLDRGLFDPPADEGEEFDETSTGPGLFGEEFGGALGGLQDKLGNTATNPLFQTGMGLLASGYDGSNPYAMIARNLSAIPGHQIAAQGADLAVEAGKRAGNSDSREQTRLDQETAARSEQIALFKAIQKMLEEGGGVQEPGSNIARGAAKHIR